MKTIILAGGYGTRLYPLTFDKPKALLDIGGRPLIDYIFDKLEDTEILNDVYVVTNNRYFNHFEQWAKNSKTILSIKLVNDGTNTNEERLGAVKDIQFVIKKENLYKDDLLIIGGDNLFDFDLYKIIESFSKLRKPMVGLYDVKDLELSKKYGTVTVDYAGRVSEFFEKSNNPVSTLAATCVYLFPKEILSLIDKYIEDGNNIDAPGNLIKWFAENNDVYGFLFEDKWYDIGSKEIYEEVNKELIRS